MSEDSILEFGLIVAYSPEALVLSAEKRIMFDLLIEGQ